MKTQKLTCKKARDISIVKTLENLGYFPKRKTEKEAWFLSPFRSENQASFKVDLRINRWYDHGSGIGGNVIDLISKLKNYSVPETLSYLNSNLDSFSFQQQPLVYIEEPYTIDKVKPLRNAVLLEYLKSRGINEIIAAKYCKEIYYSIKGKKYFAIAFENKSSGYEIRNKYFKGSLRKKDITIIENNSKTLVVFEGFIDFLSYLTLNVDNEKNHDYLILNSISFLNRVKNFKEKYTKTLTYLDNDNTGIEASIFLKSQLQNVENQSYSFKEHKDLNDFLCNNNDLDAGRVSRCVPVGTNLAFSPVGRKRN